MEIGCKVPSGAPSALAHDFTKEQRASLPLEGAQRLDNLSDGWMLVQQKSAIHSSS